MWRRVRVAGQSMAPTLREGEVLWVDMRAYRRTGPRPGDVVLAWHPDGNRKIVKRVVSAPAGSDAAQNVVYLRGDNATASTDSDQFGPLGAERVLGKILFSMSRWRRVH